MTSARGVRFAELAKYDAFYTLDHFLGRGLVNRFLGRPRQRIREAFLAGLRGQQGRVLSVDRCDELSVEAFEAEYLVPGRPVVFAGAAASWPCMAKWNLDYLRDHCRTYPVTLLPKQRTTDGFRGTRSEEQIEKTTFEQFARDLENGSGKYLRFSTMVEDRPELAADLDFHWLGERLGPRPIGRRIYTFIGSQGSRTRLHCDYPPNLFVQVQGRKHWVLYHPDYRAVIDPLLERSAASYTTNLEVREPAVAPDCISRHIDRYEVVLEPGDVLFNPAYFWHDVVNLTDTIGVSVRWLSPGIIRRAPWIPQLLDLFSTSPPVWRVGLTKRDLNSDLLDTKNRAKANPTYVG